MTFMNNTTFGILAHVDAGKTTLSESLLFTAGAIRTRGRVDHGDAFLDTDEMEKKRGITIYSKTARFEYAQGEPLRSWIRRDMRTFLRKWSGHCRYWTTRFL